LRQRYREGQEDQLGALGLVLNALILWNTRYMDAALSHLRASGQEIKPEDESRLYRLGAITSMWLNLRKGTKRETGFLLTPSPA